MKAQKYNFKTREYEPVEIPDGASMIEYDMDNEIECADWCPPSLLMSAFWK